jgi:hypothetical protein
MASSRLSWKLSITKHRPDLVQMEKQFEQTQLLHESRQALKSHGPHKNEARRLVRAAFPLLVRCAP